MKTSPSVAIMYGFAEGAYHGRRLRQVLRRKGFTLIKDAKKADIIIAHSGGCYLVPRGKASVVICVGYTYWPGRPLNVSLQALLAADYRQFGLRRWLWRCLVNDVYILNLPQTIRMIRDWPKRAKRLDAPSEARQIFICNRDDSYCEPNLLVDRARDTHAYVALPGTHTHLWDNPEPYVNLLQSVYDA